jgi:hypothetical protein
VRWSPELDGGATAPEPKTTLKSNLFTSNLIIFTCSLRIRNPKFKKAYQSTGSERQTAATKSSLLSRSVSSCSFFLFLFFFCKFGLWWCVCDFGCCWFRFGCGYWCCGMKVNFRDGFAMYFLCVMLLMIFFSLAVMNFCYWWIFCSWVLFFSVPFLLNSNSIYSSNEEVWIHPYEFSIFLNCQTLDCMKSGSSIFSSLQTLFFTERLCSSPELRRKIGFMYWKICFQDFLTDRIPKLLFFVWKLEWERTEAWLLFCCCPFFWFFNNNNNNNSVIIIKNNEKK